jgi:hypothetical protein
MKNLKKMFLLYMVLWMTTPAWAGKIINEKLPHWVNLDLQYRYRGEYKDNFDFNDSVDDEEWIHLLRTRLNVHLMLHKHMKLFAQFQDARVADQEIGSKAGNEDYADWRQLYVDWKDLKLGPGSFVPVATVRLGRQELSYGAQRLIGGFNWSNVAQTFDAGKVMLKFESYKLSIDGFGGTKTPVKTPREMNDFYDGSTHDLLAGYYATYSAIKDVALEQYLLKRKTNVNVSFGPSGSAEIDEWTAGFRVKGKIPEIPVDYDLEAAKQWGDFDDLDVDAMMAMAVVGYTFDHAWTPRLAFEFDYASGDTDSSDGDRETFDNLYPTNHLFYGYMDRVGLQNLNNYQFQASVKPTKKLKLQSDLHMIYVDTPKDSFYNAGRGVQRTATGTDVNTHVGNEVDLTGNYKVCDYADLLVGYSHFFAGKYLQETGANDDGDFFYVETTFNF